MIIIYGRGNCEWTSNSQLLCDIEQIDNQFIDLNIPANRDKIFEFEKDGIGLPAIFDNSTYIGNYQALQSWIIRKKEEETQWQVL